MPRRELIALLLVAFALITAGVVWLTGPWGLIGSGVVLGVVMMFVEIRPSKETDQ